MQRLSYYLAAQCFQVFIGLLALSLTILLLERLPHLFEVVANTSDQLAAAGWLILMITPNQLSLAMPLAFFLAVLITVDRVSRSGELSACLAAGVSLFAIVRPFLIIAALLSVLNLFISGFVQPFARYEYRKTIDAVKQRSIEAAFQEGKFAAVGDQVVWTEDRIGGSGALGRVFIFEDAKDGRDAVLTTARRGRVEPGAIEDETLVSLIDGRAISFSPNRDIVERLSFERTDWNVGSAAEAFRTRGDGWKEMTLVELIDGVRRGRVIGGTVAEADAVANAHLGRAVLMLLLPFVALPMGLGYGRTFSSAGVGVGIAFLVFLQKSLESGQAVASSGAIPGWAGTWPVAGLVLALGAWLFLRNALTVASPPLAALSSQISGVVKRLGSIGARPQKA